MNLYHRLVGLAVLGAIAVILIPLILDFRASDEPSIRHSNIPEKPAGLRLEEISLQPAPLTEPSGMRGQENDRSGNTATAISEPGTSSQAASDRGPSQAWAVKVGSFSSEENALALRNQLRSKGFNAFLDRATVEGKAILRVYVGPDIQRARSEQLRERIATELNLKEAVVVAYE